MRSLSLVVLLAQSLFAQQPATRSVFIDTKGVIRWQDDKSEVALFGANYTLPSASDYRAAGYLGLDRKKMVDEDMAHFARMGWDALRLSFWGDWENADRAGNLIVNDHLDVQDYLIATAKKRGIYILLSPIVTYNAGWPDALQTSRDSGFSRYYDRGKLGSDPAAIAAQVRYLEQVMRHVNRYTGVAYKDEPAILFVEPINEPWHHPEDRAGSIRYINTLVDAIRKTGCKKPIFYNISQDFAIADAIRASKANGLTFGWYPSALNSGHELQGNFLRTVDAYAPMLDSTVAHMPRIVYEFDSPDLRTGYMYPAMSRTFRSVGAQYAAMFAYDMLGTASRNLGWQTHYLNLVYTPRKAMSAVIAAEIMRRLPRYQTYGQYPANTKFGAFRVGYADNIAVLNAPDAFMYTSSNNDDVVNPGALKRIAGVGSSQLVKYDGNGSYFLDKVRDGVWRLEVYPDVQEIADPFEEPHVDKIVTRAVRQPHPMTIRLPDLGDSFFKSKPAELSATETAKLGVITVTPGVYILRRDISVPALPAFVNRVGIAEYHAPQTDSIPPFQLFDGKTDPSKMAFTRIGDAGRRGIYKIVGDAFRFGLPVNGNWAPDDYTASLFIGDRLNMTRIFTAPVSVSLTLRAMKPGVTVHVTLVEDDGTGWSKAVAADTSWTERIVRLQDMRVARAAMLPQGFPGQWSYWMGPAAGRGGEGDRVRMHRVERLQLSLRRGDANDINNYGVEITNVRLNF